MGTEKSSLPCYNERAVFHRLAVSHMTSRLHDFLWRIRHWSKNSVHALLNFRSILILFCLLGIVFCAVLAFSCPDCITYEFLVTWFLIWYDIFVNCKWVATRWKLYSTHLHTNNTQSGTKQTIHRTTQNLRIQKFWNSAGRAPTWRVIWVRLKWSHL